MKRNIMNGFKEYMKKLKSKELPLLPLKAPAGAFYFAWLLLVLNNCCSTYFSKPPLRPLICPHFALNSF